MLFKKDNNNNTTDLLKAIFNRIALKKDRLCVRCFFVCLFVFFSPNDSPSKTISPSFPFFPDVIFRITQKRFLLHHQPWSGKTLQVKEFF